MSGEVSIYCVNAVVYEALVGEEAEWKPLGNSAWSEMHIFKDDSEGVGNFRIVAWIPDTTEVILNTNILPDTIWEVKSDDFAELANIDEPRYGIYFPSPDVSNATTGVVNETVEKLKAVEMPAVEPFRPPPPPKDELPPAENPTLGTEGSERIVPDINPGEPPQAPQDDEGFGLEGGDGSARRHSLAEFEEVRESVRDQRVSQRVSQSQYVRVSRRVSKSQ
mmetsp:Transcript_36107/g.96621  ORF Transcript_36107/g.96621 Transcript_36107/m.96621 type:complete len:221 (+) Transcript_36107:330-992(+)